MVDNSLAKFNTTSEYNDFKASTAYTVPNVSWIVKENKIASEPYYAPLMSGIVIHKNGVFKGVSYDDFDAHYNEISAKGYTIEGVIAVPSNQTPDGTTRIISLRNMSSSTPETGTTSSDSNSKLYWGCNTFEITSLTNYMYIAKVTNASGETTIGNTVQGYLPSDAFNGVQSVVDEKAKYHSNATASDYCPSPYITGDELNPLYRMTTVTNGLSDMDGSGNTEAIIVYATAQTDWETASTITNSYSEGYYPAACCCKRYGTTGIPSGSWYLPSCGELGYVMARAGSINSLLTLINTKDPSIGVAILTGDFWTSSENGSGSARVGYFDNGLFYAAGKLSIYPVRAFASVHATPLSF